jgi:hypothetical protein
MADIKHLSPNSLAFIGLSNEYCHAIESASECEPDEFVNSMIRLLPRLYISASDLRQTVGSDDMAYIDDSLDEAGYDAARRSIETLLGEDDAYLEVFEEDMIYSDSPIAASVSEGLCDIFQVLFNFLEAVKDATEENIASAIAIISEDFGQYWSRPLCNVLRALNRIKYKQD